MGRKDALMENELNLESGGEQGRDFLEQVIRDGARRLIHEALEREVELYIERFSGERDEKGHRLVVRNGKMPKRELLTGIGPLEVEQPRVDDRRPHQRYTSTILPPYLRRTPSVDAALPALYLKGISTGDFLPALRSLLGDGARGLSSTNIVRLKEHWSEEYKAWCKRDLSDRHYVYLWADGVYFNVRLTKDRPCILVLIGALADGTKELVAVWDGERESKLSWKEVLSDLKRRGLQTPPSLAIADGALGFWAALPEVYPTTREQRCWVHKTANILNKMSKGAQPSAKKLLRNMYCAEKKEEALQAMEDFIDLYQYKFPKACECLRKDEDQLFNFYDFPQEHWLHIRTTNPIESTFATVRHRTRRTKGCGSRETTLMMVYKLAREAEEKWMTLQHANRIAQVIEGVIFIDGIHPDEAQKVA